VSSGQVGGKLVALKGLEARLKEIHAYLELVVEGRLPLNHEILYHLQVSCVKQLPKFQCSNCFGGEYRPER
jgi:hypothetical protein